MLDRLFGSRTRAKLLLLFFSNKESQFYVRELTRRVDEQINSVRRELENLSNIGILRFTEHDKKKYFYLNRSSSIFNELSALISKTSSSVAKEAIEVLQNYVDRLDLCVLTGAFVDRKDETTTDMILVGNLGQDEVKDIINHFNTIYSIQINYTYFTPSEFRLRTEVKDKFIMNVLQGDTIVLFDRNNPQNINVIAEEWSKLAKKKRTILKDKSSVTEVENDEDMQDLEALVDGQEDIIQEAQPITQDTSSDLQQKIF